MKYMVANNSKPKNKKLTVTNAIVVLLMALPGVVYLIINNYMPLYGITMAFKSPDFSLDNVLFSPYCGFDNFEFLFENPNIGKYIRNTVLYNVVFLVLNIVIPVTMAILFTNIRNKTAKKIYQTSILLPYLMSWVVISYIASALFSSKGGMIHTLIKNSGKNFDFYGAEAIGIWPFILTFFNMWKGVGFTFLFYYASMLAISPSLYEAAKLDGATYGQQIRHITLPGIKPTVIMMFILGLAGIFRSDYGLFYLVTNNAGPLYPVTQTIDTFVFNTLKVQGDLTSSSAAGLLQSAIGFVLIIAANLIVRKVDPDSAMF